jgi:ferritin-like protein
LGTAAISSAPNLFTLDRFQDRALAGSAGKILSDEVLHATVLRGVLGRDPVPTFRLIEN